MPSALLNRIDSARRRDGKGRSWWGSSGERQPALSPTENRSSALASDPRVALLLEVLVPREARLDVAALGYDVSGASDRAAEVTAA
jgi:hypothetical protein